MIIEVIVCNPDGTQAVEQRDVPDNWFEIAEPPKTPTAE